VTWPSPSRSSRQQVRVKKRRGRKSMGEAEQSNVHVALHVELKILEVTIPTSSGPARRRPWRRCEGNAAGSDALPIEEVKLQIERQARK
jgi:23S rRNA G2445 N2-methylase RlmL